MEIKITQIKSAIDRPKDQKATIEALGIRRLNSPIVKKDSPQIRGMIKKVSHLLKVEEIK